MQSAETEINALYAEIRDLVARSGEEPELQAEIHRTIERLRRLQQEEAARMRERFEARRRLKPGTGWDLLKRIEDRPTRA